MEEELKNLKVKLFNVKMKEAMKELDKLNLSIEQKEKIMASKTDPEFVNIILSFVYDFNLNNRTEMRDLIRKSSEFQIIKSK